VFVEDLDDLSARILPLTEADLDEMIRETKIGKILVREKVDLSGIKNILVAVAQIMTDYAQMTEIDLNPIKVSADQAICVDVRYNISK
jgi:acetyltransferase